MYVNVNKHDAAAAVEQHRLRIQISRTFSKLFSEFISVYYLTLWLKLTAPFHRLYELRLRMNIIKTLSPKKSHTIQQKFKE